MELVAHRGCANQYPENTVHAIEQSARRFPAVEFDVRRCRSGELVVFHDETLDRLTDGEGSVAGTDWQELSTLDVLGSGHTIPLFDDALAAVPSDVAVQVELKQTGVAADAVAAVEATGLDARITSFQAEALREVRECDSDLPVGYLFGDAVGVETGLATARALDCDSVHPSASLCLETDVVKRVHADGREVVAWGVEQRATFDSLEAAGVDAATSDWAPKATTDAEAETPLAT